MVCTFLSFFFRLKRDLAPAKGDIFELRETHQPTHAQRDVYMTSTHTQSGRRIYTLTFDRVS